MVVYNKHSSIENGKHLDSYAERSEVFFWKSIKE